MPADRLLKTVLQHYQDVHDAAKTEQIIGTTVHLLCHLTNPLNLGLLTSQLLTAPAIWHRRDGTKSALRIISIYNAAAIRIRDNELEAAKCKGSVDGSGGIRCEAWTRAVVRGADDGSRRWQHLLVLAGVLMGMEGNARRSLSRALRSTLEQAVVMAANLALRDNVDDGPTAAASIVAALNLVFPLLSEHHMTQIDCDALLPIAVWAISGEEGFCDARFLRAVDDDATRQHHQPGPAFSWSTQSASCHLLREMEKKPLMANMGPLSKLAAFAVQHARDTSAVLHAQDALLVFTSRVLDAWQKTRLSAVDYAAEGSLLSRETTQPTWPLLWQVLRKLMFSTTLVLQAIVARSLLDPHMLMHGIAHGIASKSLQILRNMFFISSRDANSAFQVYTFTYMTSLDVLSSDALATEAFLKEIQPADAVVNPSTPLHKTLHQYYLNVAEHLPLSLSTEACEALLVKPALVHLSQEGPASPATREIFESAHSVMLSALSCPQHSALTIKMAPFYIIKLFESFPQQISPRQFRVAFKTVMEIASPPLPIAAMDPHLSETLLEMLRGNLSTAGTEILAEDATPVTEAPAETQPEQLSEQSALVMTLIDSLPLLPLPLVEEWLGITAEAMNEIQDARLRAPVRKRFLEVLASGEMDVERSTIGVAWWGTKGGRELIMSGGARQTAMMSGASGGEGTSSRL